MSRYLVILDLVIALGLVACARPVPGQARAVSTVWSTYGATGSPPDIAWVTAPDLDCHPEHGVFVGWHSVGAGCVAGQTDISAWVSQVAINPTWKLHDTALAHELLHAALYRRTGDSDAGHTSPEWKTLLPAANAELREVGL